jgi:hypothetical protein
MIYIPPILELSMVGVLEAGIPNRERVCLRPTDSINLASFGLHVAIRQPQGHVTPVPNLFFWFGDFIVSPPAWIMVFTGKGESRPTPIIENGQRIYLLYWNLETTIFNIPDLLPVAFKIDSILIGHNVLPPSERQLANPAR